MNTQSEKEGYVLDLYHLPVVESTMDEAKRVLKERAPLEKNLQPTQTKTQPILFSISATEQQRGRGTNGRTWMSKKGNLFLTVAIPMSALPPSVPLTHLPLKIGNVIAHQISQFLEQREDCPKSPVISVKWPNDVLIDDKKVAGVLIENSPDANNNYWFLIGIGINLAMAPNVDKEGPERGRHATCLADYCLYNSEDEGDDVKIKRAKNLGEEIAKDIANWVEAGEEDGQDVVMEWERWAQWGKEQILRETNEVVIPIGIEKDGRLRVIGSGGVERLLSADYLL